MGVLLTKSTMPIVNWVAEVLGWLMNGIYSIGVHNLGLCIIIFTLVIYAFMTPLQIKQQKFAKMNAVMAPELQNIQKKYRGKKDQNSQLKMQEETMGVYEKYGVSPTGSCLQMLIQMPIFFALYQVIIKIPGYIGGIKDVFASAVSHITDVSGYSDIIFQFVQDNAIKNSYIPMSGKLSSDHVVDFLYSLSPAQWDKLADVDKFQGFADVLNQTADKLHPMQNFLGLNIADNPWALIQSGWSTQHYLLILAAVLIPVLAWGYTGAEYEACSDSIQYKQRYTVSDGSNYENHEYVHAADDSIYLFYIPGRYWYLLDYRCGYPKRAADYY